MSGYPEPDHAVLAAGIEWLFRTVQPADAIDQHHGACYGQPDSTRYYGFCPQGALNLPVISVNARGWAWNDGGELVGVLESGEMAATAGALTALGVVIRDQWNGDGGISGSFGLTEPAHPSLVAAVDLYQAGCPTHKTVFCGWQGLTEAERACTWYGDGNRLIMQPTWPRATEVQAVLRPEAGQR